MAKTLLLDLGVFILIGLMAARANGVSPNQIVARQNNALEPEQASIRLGTEPPPTPADRARGSPDDHDVTDPSHDSHRRNRVKRCTCYTYKDKECVYYCHLDVIWVNTPERMVPYGMSSYRGSQRARRSAADNGKTPRCFCALQSDSHCNSFCGTRAVTLTICCWRAKLCWKRLPHAFFCPNTWTYLK